MTKPYRALVNVLLLSLVLTGCATKTKFLYEYPAVVPERTFALVLGYTRVDDQRVDRSIDRIYETSPSEEISNIFKQELLSTGLFNNVMEVPNDRPGTADNSAKKNIDFIMSSTLREMKWEVPDYQAMVTKAFFISFLTGGVGGAIYGSTTTEVYGKTTMQIRFTDSRSGALVLDKEYVGQVKEEMIKFKSDIPPTKASMVGKSLKSIIEQVKTDLSQMVKAGNKSN